MLDYGWKAMALWVSLFEFTNSGSGLKKRKPSKTSKTSNPFTADKDWFHVWSVVSVMTDNLDKETYYLLL